MNIQIRYCFSHRCWFVLVDGELITGHATYAAAAAIAFPEK